MKAISSSAARVLVATVGVLLAVAACRGEEPLPSLWPTPSFSLVDQRARPFGSADLAGRAALMSFIYTHCPDTCPTLSATMADTQRRLQAEGLLGSQVQLVSVTVDPDRDSPAVLAEYAARFKADPDHWRFLTGEREAVYQVLAGFKLNTVEVARAFAGAEVVPHSNRFLVLDRTGMVRASLPGEEVSPEDLVRTLKRALAR